MIISLQKSESGIEILKLAEKLMALKPGAYTVTVKKRRKLRSNNQNRYYRGVLVLKMSLHLGIDADDMHELYKIMFNPREVVIKETGEIQTIGGTTTKLTTAEMEEYHRKIREWAYDQHRITLPLPNENLDTLIEQLQNQYDGRYN